MRAITYTVARENLAATMNRVCEDSEAVIITRNRDQALEETAYLTRSPANARRLRAARRSMEKRRGKVRHRRCD